MRLTCAWWERRAPGNELLVARTVPYVLVRGRSASGSTNLLHKCASWLVAVLHTWGGCVHQQH